MTRVRLGVASPACADDRSHYERAPRRPGGKEVREDERVPGIRAILIDRSTKVGAGGFLEA
jgi:hypothetical protein